MPNCQAGNQYGWPKFDNQAALQADGQWSKYFQALYGEIPSVGYPICIYSFYTLHDDLLQKAGIQKTAPTHASNLGDYYKMHQEFGGYLYMIYHGRNGQPAFGSNVWVEGAHCRTGAETAGAWYWYTPGSGIWVWSGNTKAYQHRVESWQDILGVRSCRDFQCGGSLFTTAKQKFNLDSIQYTEETNGNALMFILTEGVGRYTCGAAQTTWKAGWAADKPCNCDQSTQCQNCQGLGVLGSGKLSPPCSTLVV